MNGDIHHFNHGMLAHTLNLKLIGNKYANTQKCTTLCLLRHRPLWPSSFDCFSPVDSYYIVEATMCAKTIKRRTTPEYRLVRGGVNFCRYNFSVIYFAIIYMWVTSQLSSIKFRLQEYVIITITVNTPKKFSSPTTTF